MEFRRLYMMIQIPGSKENNGDLGGPHSETHLSTPLALNSSRFHSFAETMHAEKKPGNQGPNPASSSSNSNSFSKTTAGRNGEEATAQLNPHPDYPAGKSEQFARKKHRRRRGIQQENSRHSLVRRPDHRRRRPQTRAKPEKIREAAAEQPAPGPLGEE